MKKLTVCFLFTGFLTLLAIPVYSQIGLRGGVNLSKFVGADVSKAEELMGLNAGFSFSLINIGPVSLVPEIYYAEKGTRFTEQIQELQNMNPEDQEFDSNYELQFNLAYVEIPVLAKIRLPFLSSRSLRTQNGLVMAFADKIRPCKM